MDGATKRILVEVVNPAGQRVGAILPRDLNLEATARWNKLGSFRLTLRDNHPCAATLRTPGSGVIIYVNGSLFLTGRVNEPAHATSSDAPAGRVVIDGVTDDVLVRRMLAFGDPTKAATAQTDVTDDRAGAASDVLLAYLDANCGPNAIAARRITGLTLQAHTSAGPQVTKRANMQPLGDLLDQIGTYGGIGWRVDRTPTGGLTAKIVVPTDRSATIRLDITRGHLTERVVSQAPPECTRVIVAGRTDDGAGTLILERSNAASLAAEALWGMRVEKRISTTAKGTSAVAQAGDDELARSGFSTPSVTAKVADNALSAFASMWAVGDTVSVVTPDGALPLQVTDATITASPRGTAVGVTLGPVPIRDRGLLDDITNVVNEHTTNIVNNSYTTTGSGTTWTPWARQVTTFATWSTGLFSVNLAAGYRLLAISTATPTRVRLYQTNAQMISDKSRPATQDPDTSADHGLVLEATTSTSLPTVHLSPTVDGYCPAGTTVYWVADVATTITLTWIRTE